MSAANADERTDAQRARAAAFTRAGVLVDLSRRLKTGEGTRNADPCTTATGLT